MFVYWDSKRAGVDYLVAERETLEEEIGERQKGGKRVRLGAEWTQKESLTAEKQQVCFYKVIKKEFNQTPRGKE